MKRVLFMFSIFILMSVVNCFANSPPTDFQVNVDRIEQAMFNGVVAISEYSCLGELSIEKSEIQTQENSVMSENLSTLEPNKDMEVLNIGYLSDNFIINPDLNLYTNIKIGIFEKYKDNSFWIDNKQS